MPEDKIKPSESPKSEPKAPTPTAAPELASTGASSDGAIQHLAALRQIHAMNNDAKAAEEVTAQLNELGYA